MYLYFQLFSIYPLPEDDRNDRKILLNKNKNHVNKDFSVCICIYIMLLMNYLLYISTFITMFLPERLLKIEYKIFVKCLRLHWMSSVSSDSRDVCLLYLQWNRCSDSNSVCCQLSRPGIWNSLAVRLPYHLFKTGSGVF